MRRAAWQTAIVNACKNIQPRLNRAALTSAGRTTLTALVLGTVLLAQAWRFVKRTSLAVPAAAVPAAAAPQTMQSRGLTTSVPFQQANQASHPQP